MATFGDIRFRISKMPSGAGIDPVLRDGVVNDVLEEIYNSYDWSRLEIDDVPIQTIATYSVGTVTVTNGLNTVVGSGTTFDWTMTGRRFRADGGLEWYTFTFVDTTHGTLERVYEGSTSDPSGSGYGIYQPVYTLANDVDILHGVKVPHINWDLVRQTREELDTYATARIWRGAPRSYAPYDNDPTTQAPRIEIYPVPDTSTHLLYHYKAGVPKLVTATTAIPTWVMTSCVIQGCDAVMSQLGAAPRNRTEGIWAARFAAGKDQKYERLLNLMINRDIERKESPQLRMAQRFVSHRKSRLWDAFPNHYLELRESDGTDDV